MSLGKPDIKIALVSKQPAKELQASQLVLELTGKSSNSAVVNTLRRLALDYIPTYAFTPETINIEENTSIFDNDYMKLRLSQLTIPNIPVEVSYLPEAYWYNIDYADPERPKHPDDKETLEIYLNKVNATSEVMHVTTQDLLVILNGKELKKFDPKYPLLLIQLRPKEVFKCHARAVLGVGKRNDTWAGAANAYFEELDDHKFILTLETQGQLDEFELLSRGCDIIKNKMTEIKQVINTKYATSEIKNGKLLHLSLVHEDHTTTAMINEFLQLHPNTTFSGLSKPNLLEEEMVIKFMTINKDPTKPLFETLDFIVDLVANIKAQLIKLAK